MAATVTAPRAPVLAAAPITVIPAASTVEITARAPEPDRRGRERDRQRRNWRWWTGGGGTGAGGTGTGGGWRRPAVAVQAAVARVVVERVEAVESNERGSLQRTFQGNNHETSNSYRRRSNITCRRRC